MECNCGHIGEKKIERVNDNIEEKKDSPLARIKNNVRMTRIQKFTRNNQVHFVETLESNLRETIYKRHFGNF